MTIEAEILQAVYQVRTPLASYFFQSITALGSTAFALVFLLGLYIIEERDLAKKTFWSGILAAVITWSLKITFGRARPDVEQQIGQEVFNLSFPSGHTAGAFALATVLAWRKPEAWPYFYILAVLVGISRIYLGLHYPTDIIAGAAVGCLSALIILRKEELIEYIRAVHKKI